MARLEGSRRFAATPCVTGQAGGGWGAWSSSRSGQMGQRSESERRPLPVYTRIISVCRRAGAGLSSVGGCVGVRGRGRGVRSRLTSAFSGSGAVFALVYFLRRLTLSRQDRNGTHRRPIAMPSARVSASRRRAWARRRVRPLFSVPRSPGWFSAPAQSGGGAAARVAGHHGRLSRYHHGHQPSQRRPYPDAPFRKFAADMKHQMIAHCATALLGALAPGLVDALCLYADHADSPCRYPAGDAWCAAKDGVNLFAYKDHCGEGERPADGRAQARPPVKSTPGQPVAVWSCAQAKTVVERLICANPDLRAQDTRMGALYAEAQARGQSPERMQSDWLTNQRNACENADCLRGPSTPTESATLKRAWKQVRWRAARSTNRFPSPRLSHHRHLTPRWRSSHRRRPRLQRHLQRRQTPNRHRQRWRPTPRRESPRCRNLRHLTHHRRASRRDLTTHHLHPSRVTPWSSWLRWRWSWWAGGTHGAFAPASAAR